MPRVKYALACRWTKIRVVALGMMASSFLGACQAGNGDLPQGPSVKVERVISGQTIEISDPQAPSTERQQVKLIGVESPDLKQQPWGLAAKKKLKDLIEGQNVLLESDVQNKDRFDRRLAYIWQDNRLVNEIIIEDGYVLAEASLPEKQKFLSPNAKYNIRFLRAQEKARLMGVGIWDPEEPMRETAREFRLRNAR